MPYYYSILLSFSLILTLACQKITINTDIITTYDYKGQVKKIEHLGTYSALDAVQFLQLSNPSIPLSTTCDFELYRFNYLTHRFDQKEIIVSGLVAIPHTTEVKGLVSWHHGTNTYRATSISLPTSDEGIGLSALFAGDGYILIAPDYIGLGVSEEIHPYYHVESTTNAIIDFIKIGEIILNNLTNNTNNKLFLAGFSQGGGASVATQRALEKHNPTHLQLKATASIAGAFNLKDISFPYGIKHHKLGYIGYAVNAYCHIYNQPIESVITPEYADKIPKWFDGTKNGKFLRENLPKTTQELVKADVLTALEQNTPHWIIQAIADNEVYDWKPIQKLRLYYGTKDIDVSPQEALQAHEHMTSLGGNVTIQNIGEYDHNQSVRQALQFIQQWFNSIE